MQVAVRNAYFIENSLCLIETCRRYLEIIKMNEYTPKF